MLDLNLYENKKIQSTQKLIIQIIISMMIVIDEHINVWDNVWTQKKTILKKNKCEKLYLINTYIFF